MCFFPVSLCPRVSVGNQDSQCIFLADTIIHHRGLGKTPFSELVILSRHPRMRKEQKGHGFCYRLHLLLFHYFCHNATLLLYCLPFIRLNPNILRERNCERATPNEENRISRAVTEPRDKGRLLVHLFLETYSFRSFCLK